MKNWAERKVAGGGSNNARCTKSDFGPLAAGSCWNLLRCRLHPWSIHVSDPWSFDRWVGSSYSSCKWKSLLLQLTTYLVAELCAWRCNQKIRSTLPPTSPNFPVSSIVECATWIGHFSKDFRSIWSGDGVCDTFIKSSGPYSCSVMVNAIPPHFVVWSK